MWFFYALSFALITSISSILAKRIMRDIDEYLFLWLSAISTVPVLGLIILLFYEIPKIDSVFFIAIFTSTAIGMLVAILAYRAIRIAEVSLVAPISAFNPVFTTLFALFFLGEKMGVKELLGIGLVVLGSYILQISKIKGGFIKPFKILISNKAVQYSLLAYLIWAITPIFEKTAISHTFPVVPPFVAFTSFAIGTFLYIPIVSKYSKSSLKSVKKYLKWFIVIGILGGIGQSSAFISFNLANLGSVTAIFKLSMVFTVILGWLFFKEKNIRYRLLGSLIMLLGVYFLVK